MDLSNYSDPATRFGISNRLTEEYSGRQSTEEFTFVQIQYIHHTIRHPVLLSSDIMINIGLITQSSGVDSPLKVALSHMIWQKYSNSLQMTPAHVDPRLKTDGIRDAFAIAANWTIPDRFLSPQETVDFISILSEAAKTLHICLEENTDADEILAIHSANMDDSPSSGHTLGYDLGIRLIPKLIEKLESIQESLRELVRS
ncbi:hypothetical protein C8J56DRAFT_884033 [Mycena floridula]|nr:hypothetical protein C8J56DRAFT_884033 [Mycena floridula]